MQLGTASTDDVNILAEHNCYVFAVRALLQVEVILGNDTLAMLIATLVCLHVAFPAVTMQYSAIGGCDYGRGSYSSGCFLNFGTCVLRNLSNAASAIYPSDVTIP